MKSIFLSFSLLMVSQVWAQGTIPFKNGTYLPYDESGETRVGGWQCPAFYFKASSDNDSLQLKVTYNQEKVLTSFKTKTFFYAGANEQEISKINGPTIVDQGKDYSTEISITSDAPGRLSKKIKATFVAEIPEFSYNEYTELLVETLNSKSIKVSEIDLLTNTVQSSCVLKLVP